MLAVRNIGLTLSKILLVKSDKQWLIKEFDENIVNALLFGLGDFDDFDLFGGELEIDLDFDDFEVNDGNQ